MNYGVKREVVKHVRDFDFEIVCGNVDESVVYPAQFEIPRDRTGTQKDQGNVGACVAEVVCQIAEEGCRRMTAEALEMSEGYAYGTLRENFDGQGLFPSQALKLWMQNGTLPKRYLPYLKEMPEMREICEKNSVEFAEIARRYKPSGFVALNYADKEKRDKSIKQALTTYMCGLLAVSDKYFGESHAVLLTGWDDEKDVYSIKNSWGADWKDGGFGTVPKDKVDGVWLILFDNIDLPFLDVPPDAWYANDVKKVYFSGLMQGVSDDAFAPDKPLTRAEMACLLNRLAKETDLRFDVVNQELERLKR